MARAPERPGPRPAESGLRSPGAGVAGSPVFVVGNSRSGTTMVGRMLGRHPLVFTLGEIHFFEQLWSGGDEERLPQEEATRLAARLICTQRDGYLGRGDPARFYAEARKLLPSEPSAAPDAAGVFLRFLLREAERNGKAVPCDQTPRNVFYIGEILRLYPRARVVNLVRDPRDVLLSQKRKWKRRFLGAEGIPLREALRAWINYHPLVMSALWNSSVRAADRFAGHGRVHSLRFEDLLVDPEGEIENVCDFLGVSFDRGMLRVPQVGSSGGLDRPDRRGVDPDRAGSWRRGGLGATEIFVCQKVTGGLMRRHGYAPEPVTPNALALAAGVVVLPAMLGFALAANLGRLKSLRGTIRRRLT